MISIRKQKILCILVARYIETAQPVSSGDIKNDYGEEISSATIRAELAALEELGYLMQPHVSAGRIPTAKAYKLFVETIPTEGIALPQVADMRAYLDRKMEDVSDVIRHTAQILSDTTNYTSVIVVKNVGNVRVRSIKLVDLGADKALVVIITDSGVLKDSIIDLPTNMGENYVKTSSDLLNRMFADLTVDEIRSKMQMVEEEITAYKDVLDQIITTLEQYGNGNAEVFVEGTSKLLDYPEYNTEVDNMRSVLALLEHKEVLEDIVGDSGLEVSFRIGKEDGIEHGSLVSATYRINGNQEVRAGVIGPERMDYKKVVNVLQYLEKTIMSMLDDKEDK